MGGTDDHVTKEQRDAFERGEENWLEHEESGTAVAAAMRNLRGAWLSNAREYVGAAVGRK